jgi:hypothetical protein
MDVLLPFVENFVLNFVDLDRKSFEKSSDKVCDKVFDKGKANASPCGSIPATVWHPSGMTPTHGGARWTF